MVGTIRRQDIHDTPKAILNGNVFVFKQNATLLGMVVLFDKPSDWDRQLWKNENLNDGIYLHRLAINREMAGKSLGSEIMQWAEEGIVFNNKKCIRLDCIEDSSALNRFYQNQGYQLKGLVNGFNKYEKALKNDVAFN